ncbi:protein FAM187B isoform X2 [Meriones unguiculatus]|uniref:protein FAM187B isoform X2 n=1 Tax=Meriones unguiculatus TaxID=10047 RepID=UPI00293ED25F|nr:protein FAM187B isoform X2 [Meriones unguiculatus]
MVTILWILLSFALPVSGLHVSVSCPQAKECQLALLSQNSVLLECSTPTPHWSFSEVDKDGDPVGLSGDFSVVKDPHGGLLIPNPSPLNTGLYQCRDENGTKVASYRIDFQDISRLHTTHLQLGQKPLMNTTLSLSHNEMVYTRWEPWQECSSCGKPGERKRLGYCYIKEPLEESVPCGLYLGGRRMRYFHLRPEMQVESCLVSCRPAPARGGGDYVVFDSFTFMEESESAWLTCPTASIYRPVHWEANNTALTWHDQLAAGEYSSTILDLHSGGQKLQVFQPAIYRCFVQQELVAQFNPTASVDQLEAERQPRAQWLWQSRAQPGKADSVLRGLKLLLLVVFVLAVGGLLRKVVFRPPRGKKNQVLLVK